MSSTLLYSNIASLPLIRRGKVRDIYAVDDKHLLIVACDRISAFDVVLPTPIPGKGEVLTALSNSWFKRMHDLVPNHCTTLSVADSVPDAADRPALQGRAMIVRKLQPLPIEAIVRGYLVGSGWKEYGRTSAVCGIPLPAGLRQAERLPETLFTPSTKAEDGEHDKNITFAEAENLIGRERAAQVRKLSLRIYEDAAAYALEHGIIIADTKFEFASDEDGQMVLIDEVLTPDSSRFWPVDGYATGVNPPSFDKQYVRDYLETLDWDKRAPAPPLPPEVVDKTVDKYREAYRRLVAQGNLA